MQMLEELLLYRLIEKERLHLTRPKPDKRDYWIVSRGRNFLGVGETLLETLKDFKERNGEPLSVDEGNVLLKYKKWKSVKRRLY